jgi:hypothetical protein
MWVSFTSELTVVSLAHTKLLVITEFVTSSLLSHDSFTSELAGQSREKYTLSLMEKNQFPLMSTIELKKKVNQFEPGCQCELIHFHIKATSANTFTLKLPVRTLVVHSSRLIGQLEVTEAGYVREAEVGYFVCMWNRTHCSMLLPLWSPQ